MGRVSANGNPLANAVLELTGESGTLTAKTDANGNYRFDNVTAGSHSLTVTGGGITGHAEFSLNESSTTELKTETDEKGITKITVGEDIRILEINFTVRSNGTVEISAQLPPKDALVPYTGVQSNDYPVLISAVCVLSIFIIAVSKKKKQREK
jgi:hypothetical protein